MKNLDRFIWPLGHWEMWTPDGDGGERLDPVALAHGILWCPVSWLFVPFVLAALVIRRLTR